MTAVIRDVLATLFLLHDFAPSFVSSQRGEVKARIFLEKDRFCRSLVARIGWARRLLLPW